MNLGLASTLESSFIILANSCTHQFSVSLDRDMATFCVEVRTCCN